MIIESPTSQYKMGVLVVENAVSRTYLCQEVETGRRCLFQIAKRVEDNGALDRAAYILGRLAAGAAELEADFARAVGDAKKTLGYANCFAELVQSFVCAAQDNRRVNILAFRHVDSPSQLVPIVKIVEVDRLRADLRTTAWIMGKTLKLLAFTHDLGIASGPNLISNLLLEPDQHFVLFFDWTEASLHEKKMPREIRTAEIAQAAEGVIMLAAGDESTGVFPDDERGRLKPYTDHLLFLAHGGAGDAFTAHGDFYKLIDTIWERVFYPATFLPR